MWLGFCYLGLLFILTLEKKKKKLFILYVHCSFVYSHKWNSKVEIERDKHSNIISDEICFCI